MDVNTREFRQLVGEKIKAERERTGLTQKEFAKKVGLSNQTYNNLENGIGSLKLEHLYKISEKCGCDMGYLLGECNDRTFQASDISKITGLSEEASYVLSSVKDSNDSFDVVFMDLVNRIIESYKYSDYEEKKEKQTGSYFPLSEEELQINPNYFPMYELVRFTQNLRATNEFKNYKSYEMVLKAEKEYMDHLEKKNELESHIDWDNISDTELGEWIKATNLTYPNLRELYKKHGLDLDDEKAEKTHRLFSQVVDFINMDKKIMRNEISYEFENFLRSDFIEGKTNGK